MKPALERLEEHPGVGRLGPAELDALTAHPGPTVLLFPGDPLRKPEVHDMAVVAREMVRSRPGLRVLVVPLEHDRVVRARLEVNKVPSMAFVRDGRIIDVLGGIQDWAVYRQALARLLEEPVNP